MVAGQVQNVYVRSDTTAVSGSDKIDGIKTFDVQRSRDMDDVTDTKDGTGYKLKQPQLADTKITMDGQFEQADAVQAILRSAYDTGALVYVSYQTDPTASAGSKGYRVAGYVSEYSAKIDPDKAGAFSCSVEGHGAPVAI
jgi:hypothetical protein